MEENKEKNCCENNSCGKNEHCCKMDRCCMWKKCHGMKHIVWIVLIIIVFCLGVQFGELKSEARGEYRFNRGNMMDWKYKNVTPLTGNELPGTPATPEAPVTQ